MKPNNFFLNKTSRKRRLKKMIIKQVLKSFMVKLLTLVSRAARLSRILRSPERGCTCLRCRCLWVSRRACWRHSGGTPRHRRADSTARAVPCPRGAWKTRRGAFSCSVQHKPTSGTFCANLSIFFSQVRILPFWGLSRTHFHLLLKKIGK